MEVVVGKQLSHFFDEVVEKFVSALPRGIHGWIKYSPLPLDFIRTRPAGQFGIAEEPRRAVTRHIKLRDHADPTLGSVGNQFTGFRLRVKQSVGTHFMQLGKFLALDTETLVLR